MFWYREINFCGVYLAPFFIMVLIAGLCHVPLHWCLDRLKAERWVWNRPIAEAALFVILLRLVSILL